MAGILNEYISEVSLDILRTDWWEEIDRRVWTFTSFLKVSLPLLLTLSATAVGVHITW